MEFKINYSYIVTQEPPWATPENLKTKQPKILSSLRGAHIRQLNRANKMENNRKKGFPEYDKQDSQVTEFIIFKMLI